MKKYRIRENSPLYWLAGTFGVTAFFAVIGFTVGIVEMM